MLARTNFQQITKATLDLGPMITFAVIFNNSKHDRNALILILYSLTIENSQTRVFLCINLCINQKGARQTVQNIHTYVGTYIL